jgi:peptidoglycan L-alanyl-D-glutamate endopeptidase CwlK
MIDNRRKYADSITLDRIRFLHPEIREKVLNTYLTVNAQSLGTGVRLRFTYTLRTIAEQDALYAYGRTRLFDDKGNRLGKVTNAKGYQSLHNYGLAFDIVLLLDVDRNGIYEKASWDVMADWDGDKVPDWQECVNAFKAIGAEWGGDWKWKDKPHLQFSVGLRWQQMKAKMDKRDYVEEVIDGKIYKWINLK